MASCLRRSYLRGALAIRAIEAAPPKSKSISVTSARFQTRFRSPATRATRDGSTRSWAQGNGGVLRPAVVLAPTTRRAPSVRRVHGNGGDSSKGKVRRYDARRSGVRGEDGRSRTRRTKNDGGRKGRPRSTGERRRPTGAEGRGVGEPKSLSSFNRTVPPESLLSALRRRFGASLPALYLPGGKHRLTDPGVLSSIAWRIPPALVLFYLLVLSADADLHPYSPSPGRLEMCYGPSMLPTFAPYGDIMLRDSISHRLPGRWKREWRKGDVVVFVDYKTQLACKRIVAVGGAGDGGKEKVRVRRHGQFVERFADRDDWGAPDPAEVGSPPVPDPRAWDEGARSLESDGPREEEEMVRTVAVPEGHVWLEGDCPELSTDSRQYGPVPIGRLRGRIVARIWPLDKRAAEGEKWPFLSQDRPAPISVDELIQDETYNLQKREFDCAQGRHESRP